MYKDEEMLCEVFRWSLSKVIRRKAQLFEAGLVINCIQYCTMSHDLILVIMVWSLPKFSTLHDREQGIPQEGSIHGYSPRRERQAVCK